MDQFVCVRMVQGNGMDLSLFQFDYDMSFAVFFLNADRSIYGRYGTRSKKPKEAHTDISLEGVAEAMQATLTLHKKFPANRSSLAGKTGAPSKFAVPEKMPALQGKYWEKLAEGDQKTISRSCIHCHQIRDAERSSYFTKGLKLPTKVLYPWPMPEVIGMNFDRRKRATLKNIAPDSPASKAGLRRGDEILRVNEQPIISIADVQWILHNADQTDSLKINYRRSGQLAAAEITLAPKWREQSDISWRTSSWALRRMTSGGLVLESLPEDKRKAAGVGENQLALRVMHVGQYGKHAAAKKAGFRKNDLIVSYDGKTEAWNETAFFAYVLNNQKPGARVSTTVSRSGKKIELELPVQD